MEDITTFEMLPDEMILLVCQHLRCAEILYSFFNLNSRLNSTITDFCHYVNLKNVTYKQFDFVATQIIPQIGPSIRSFIFNGQWENIMPNKVDLTFFHSKLSLMLPQLHTMSLVNFIDRQLNLFLDKITDLLQLVKLEIRNLRNEHGEGSLEKILAANNNRLKSVLFDYDSIRFILTKTKNDKASSYPSIEELMVNLKTDKTLEHLFILIPHVNRLHIDFHQLSSTSKSALANISSFVHLKNFQLRSINIYWSLDEIAYILITFQSTQPVILHLPQLKSLYVKGTYEIFHLVRAAPNLEHLNINFNCLSMVLDDASTCELLNKGIVDLEITDFQEVDSIQLDGIAQKFNHLRDLSLALKNPTVFVDSLILKVILLWRDKNLRSLYINGSLTDEMSKNFRQWLINHSHLCQEDLFTVEYKTNWITLWLQ
ncbi:unnamed protein product [Rotaria sp. Silwood2]|nr:unnamed protein product [Rotaria sp. Silwood2]CAF4291057.1 unnamed protein product [Rotaria sp. Silwood2]